MPLNTTGGVIPRPGERPGHALNTSRAVEEDLTYLDEESEIISVVPATGWHAVIGEDAVPLVAFVAMDDAKMYGVAVSADGRIDLTDSVEKDPGFAGYGQVNSNDKENQ